LSFSLDQLPNYTDFTSLFDHYSIDRVDITLIPGVNPAQVAACPDFDDAVTPSGLADLLERQSCKVSVLGPNSYQQFRVSLVPRMPIEGAGGAGPQMAPVGTMVDTSDPSMQYFGMKFWFTPTNSVIATPFLGWSVMIAYHLRFAVAK
jgi:hypothetical protein